jgi:uncharacterized protein (TIGR02145 family)
MIQPAVAMKMTGAENRGRAIHGCIAWFALSLAFGLACGPVAPGQRYSSKRMADGKQWMTRNLNIRIAGSYCYEDAEMNCRQYGRLYSWESAKQACQLLGSGWRLPTNDEWRQMAKRYGGVREDAIDGGKEAYQALLVGGNSGFNVVLGGNRAEDGRYARLAAHGFYWTASESRAANAWLYNFGKGSRILNRHSDGSKQMAISVRCVRD